MKYLSISKILLFIIAASSFSCRMISKKDTHTTDVIKKDIIVENIDTTVSPGQDFFKYANGVWLKNNPIPPTESYWGIGSIVKDSVYNSLKKISEAAASKGQTKGSSEQKIGDFYFSGMDSVAIEQARANPLSEELSRINSIKNIGDVLNVIALYQTYNLSPLFGYFAYQDSKHSDKIVSYLWQSGISLPDRDYYFNKDARTEKIRNEFVIHMSKMFQLLGDDSIAAKKNANAVMKIETGLAKFSRKLEDLRDPNANYNKYDIATLNKITPAINWSDMFSKMGVSSTDSVIVGQPEFLKQVQSELKNVSIEDWKNYLRWNLINEYASNLSSDFEKQNFYFKGTILSGVTEQQPRWKRVLDEEQSAMGELLGQLYVSKYFPSSAKQRYLDMVDNIALVYKERIKNLDWMSEETKSKAITKLNSLVKKIGYPDEWKDYSTLETDRGPYVLNVLRGDKWKYQYMINKLGKPVNRKEWDMTPQTYNAYYNPSNNEIVFPAAILIIPGMPDSLIDDALRYGYVGATIGHEMTHGFDDEGRQFDEKGNLTDWWTKEDADKFNSRTQKMINQFNNFIVLDSLHINGRASLGENIADLGGLIIAYQAFKKTKEGQSAELINGFTPDQRFFLGYAYSWLGHKRDEAVAQQVMSNVHAPEELRVNGPLANMPEFYSAFHVKPTEPLYLPDSLRVNIW